MLTSSWVTGEQALDVSTGTVGKSSGALWAVLFGMDSFRAALQADEKGRGICRGH